MINLTQYLTNSKDTHSILHYYSCLRTSLVLKSANTNAISEGVYGGNFWAINKLIILLHSLPGNNCSEARLDWRSANSWYSKALFGCVLVRAQPGGRCSILFILNMLFICPFRIDRSSVKFKIRDVVEQNIGLHVCALTLFYNCQLI